MKKLHKVVKQISQNCSLQIGEATHEKLVRTKHDRLARECVRLDPKFEKAMVEEGMK